MTISFSAFTCSFSPPTDSKVTPMSISIGCTSARLEPAFDLSLNIALLTSLLSMFSGLIFSLSKFILLDFRISKLASSLSLDSVGELVSPVRCLFLVPLFLPRSLSFPALPPMALLLIRPWSLLEVLVPSPSLVPGKSSVYRLTPPSLFFRRPYFFLGLLPFLCLGRFSSSLSLLELSSPSGL